MCVNTDIQVYCMTGRALVFLLVLLSSKTQMPRREQ